MTKLLPQLLNSSWKVFNLKDEELGRQWSARSKDRAVISHGKGHLPIIDY